MSVLDDRRSFAERHFPEDANDPKKLAGPDPARFPANGPDAVATRGRSDGSPSAAVWALIIAIVLAVAVGVVVWHRTTAAPARPEGMPAMPSGEREAAPPLADDLGPVSPHGPSNDLTKAPGSPGN